MTAEQIIVCFCGQQIDVYFQEIFLAVMILFMFNKSKEHMKTVLQAGRTL